MSTALCSSRYPSRRTGTLTFFSITEVAPWRARTEAREVCLVPPGKESTELYAPSSHVGGDPRTADRAGCETTEQVAVRRTATGLVVRDEDLDTCPDMVTRSAHAEEGMAWESPKPEKWTRPAATVEDVAQRPG